MVHLCSNEHMANYILPYGDGSFHVRVTLAKGMWDEAVRWLDENVERVRPLKGNMPWRIASTVRSFDYDEMGVVIKDEILAHQFFLTFASAP